MATVLVVDDDPMIRTVLVESLELEGYRVLQAPHGAEALRLLRDDDVDLVLLDLVMPVLDGWGFLEGIRRLQLPQPQTVVMTSYLPLLLHDEASPVEARVVLEKPFDLNQALRTIEELTAA